MAGIVAQHRQQMKFCNSHLTHNIFNLYMRRFFFGLVYTPEVLVCTQTISPGYLCKLRMGLFSKKNKSREGGNDKESIQSSTPPDPDTTWESNKHTKTSRTREPRCLIHLCQMDLHTIISSMCAFPILGTLGGNFVFVQIQILLYVFTRNLISRRVQ